ncbi:caspase domain-containing protein [Peribacillus sp. SCS-37]|uniref:caspase family protein n=1 Tax=Paraperibacillus esterisolvens TaxID=3115296 RepID=UPI003905F59D
MRKALLVGINHYIVSPLNSCIQDAEKLASILKRNADGSPNFHCRTLLSNGEVITKYKLQEEIQELLEHESDLALFYFSGHGSAGAKGGYLVTQDAAAFDEGLPMDEFLEQVNASRVREIIILLDCCHSGYFGQEQPAQETAILREGVSILTSSRSTQASYEEDGGGIFTSLIYNALEGGAADVLGNITAAGLYAYVDQALGPWDQRPLFKSHVSRLSSIRKCTPDIPVESLRLLPSFFKKSTDEYRLDPTYEKHFGHNHKEHENIFGLFQGYRNARLLTPMDAGHLFFAARDSKPVSLTALGRYYWKLAKEELI